MRDKTFVKVMAAIAITGVLTTGLLIWYTVDLRQKCSIITYIANERGGPSWFSRIKTSWLIHHGAVPGGYTKCEEHYDDGFMDYTDYCKYYYTKEEDDTFAMDDRYRKVENDDIGTIRGYFEYGSPLMAGQEGDTEFDFDSSCISAGDYVYIDTKEDEKRLETQDGILYYGKYDWYSVYLYDCDSHILYYVHNNM